jgi:hypothetical protein
MIKTLNTLLASRHWIAHIDDERGDGNSIIVTLVNGWDYEDEKGCGVRGFDTVAEAKAGTSRHKVVQRVIHIKMARAI